MFIGISNQCYEHKPTQDDIEKMRFTNREVSIDRFSSLISQGYSYTTVMNGKRNRDNFACSYILTYDIDNSSTEMMDCINHLEYKPTFAYTSPSNGLEGYGCRYRLIYCLEEPITSFNEYYSLSRSFGTQLNLTDVDPKSYYPEQYWNGCKDCQVYKSYTVYEKDIINIKEEYKKDISVDKNNKKYNRDKIADNESITQTYIKQPQHIGLSDTFEDDYWNMSFRDILDKYDYPNIEHTPIEYDDSLPMITYPDEYYEIRRPSYKTKGGHTRKIKDGEKRRNKLYLNGIVRRKINPDISFDNLLYNLVYEFYYYYINNGNKIDKKILYQIARNVMKAKIRKSNLGRPKYKSFANPLYCQKYNLSRREVSDLSKNKRRFISEFYDINLTDKENIEIMKENGLMVALPTLKRWKKENGITKYKKRSRIP